ncbi:hypothetical protein BDZ45DRAFT_497834 [Acephala macrosclerotiorum]|nr:hypothetical protein BDZ45DRAFT_497834 [Acephala macrosclerotiorum]
MRIAGAALPGLVSLSHSFLFPLLYDCDRVLEKTAEFKCLQEGIVLFRSVLRLRYPASDLNQSFLHMCSTPILSYPYLCKLTVRLVSLLSSLPMSSVTNEVKCMS